MGSKLLSREDDDNDSISKETLIFGLVAAVAIFLLLAILLLLCWKYKWWQSLSKKFSSSSLCSRVEQTNDLSVWPVYRNGQASSLGYPALNITRSQQFSYTNEAAHLQAYTYDGRVSGDSSGEVLEGISLPSTTIPPPVSSVDFCDRRGIPDDFLYDLRKQEDTSKIKTVHGKLVVCVSRWVDHRGAVLMLDCMGISLTIPPGALETSRRELISLTLVWDLNDGPKLTEKQGLVSPVVHCGPHGLTLKRPCTLTYKHCAFEPTLVSTWTSETHLFGDKKWRMLCKKRDTDRQCSFLGDECIVRLNHFSLYTSLMTAEDGGVVRKWIQMVPFSYALRDGRFYEVRVYLLNNTPCALQFARYKEGELGGRQCNAEKLLLFEGDGSNLKLELTTLCEGWTNTDAPKEDVQFVQLWHNLCPYASFCFQRDNPAVSDISLTIVAYQRSRAEDSAKLRILAATEPGQSTWSTGDQNSSRPGSSRSSMPSSEKDVNCSQVGTPLLGLPGPRVPRIPHPLRMKLQMLLDARSTLGNDWRAFAGKLNLDHCIRWLETQPSPMAILLDRFEEEGRTIQDLGCLLYQMERLDAAATVMDHLKEVEPRRGSDDHTTDTSSDVTMATGTDNITTSEGMVVGMAMGDALTDDQAISEDEQSTDL
ncbi:UNC5CL [Branchiostoma lanceolatum]|uniref:Netrin receptor UNC5 n=1 Tax=Branchiostoma lanceolatum TaxID=7740 RepID=A0A8J9ZG59_BRALA|nr:UNC5CL [Branchiostoma lanceolatum]